MTRHRLSKKVRFEVFKRDSFACQYCGAKAPDVLLQVDHIEPVSKGGTDDLLNLVTSCRACNAGKSDRQLSDTSAVEKRRGQLAELQERKEQLEMMLNWQRGLAHLDECALEEVAAFWSGLVSPYHLTESGMSGLRRMMNQYELDEVMEAMRIAVNQYVEYEGGQPTKESVEKAWGKVRGICRVKHSEDEKPYLRDILYVRGILRHRLAYVDEHRALDLLESSVQLGADIEWLRRHATQVRNWTQWRTELEGFIHHQLQDDTAG